MDSVDTVAAIQGLHQDLIALSESRLPTIDRLLLDLDAHVEALRRLLDHKPKSQESRDRIAVGMNADGCLYPSSRLINA